VLAREAGDVELPKVGESHSCGHPTQARREVSRKGIGIDGGLILVKLRQSEDTVSAVLLNTSRAANAGRNPRPMEGLNMGDG
jgi:hypothetical protein